MFWNTNVKGEGVFPIPFSFSAIMLVTLLCQAKKMDLQVSVPKLAMTPAWELRKSGNVFLFLVMGFNFL